MIIKPVLDVLGDFDVETIGVMSSVTVLAMSIVSVGRHIVKHSKIEFRTALPLACGSMAGGLLGQIILKRIISSVSSEQIVTVAQNAVLFVLILSVFLYMCNKNKIKSHSLDGFFISIFVGIFLGFCSSFLGIGGGPINVALIIYLFGYDTKSATICSIITILFAQLTKLGSVALGSGFAAFDLSMLPFMVVGAVAGGFIGTSLNNRLSESAVDKSFNGVQLVVLLLTVYNIIQNLL